MCGALCLTTMQNHLIYLNTFRCHTVCAHDKSVPCCGTPDNQTHPHETHSTTSQNTLSQPFVPQKQRTALSLGK